jgi:hypothetical protein
MTKTSTWRCGARRIARGFASESFLWSTANTIRGQAMIYQLGDHDPSGLAAWKHVQTKLREFAPDVEIIFERIAVTEQQIAAYNLPTRPTKITDSRAKSFVGESVEVDAIPHQHLAAACRGRDYSLDQWGCVGRYPARRGVGTSRAAGEGERMDVMTWPKFGSEFPAQCAEADLSDAAVRTHVEAICYLYEVESKSLEIRKLRMRTIALSPDWEAAIVELLAKGFWLETTAGYRVVHHADVVRQSLAAQQNKRERDKKSQQNKRARDKQDDHVSADVSDDVIPDTGRQTDKQTDAYREGSSRGGEAANEYDKVFLKSG